MTDHVEDYEAVPYPGQAFLETHPDRLAAVATLFGLTPAPVERCRVLELGCGDGGNLIPIAASLPGATVVGVDLAAGAIAAGQAATVALGLSNIALHHLDLREVPAEWGRFDYIIAHGVYSWVPPAVQAGLLAVCQRHLADAGVAYVSYNALPGWRLYGLIRDLLLHLMDTTTSPRTRAAAALQALETLATTLPEPDDPYANLMYYIAGLIQAELPPTAAARLGYVFHDLIADYNEALSLSEFVARAARHDLHYLGPADFPAAGLADASPAVVAALGSPAGPAVVRQQYADDLIGTAFHRTLLCRVPGLADTAPTPERLRSLALASPARPAGDQPPTADIGAGFETEAGNLVLDTPVSIAALTELSQCWPRALWFADLHRATRARLGPVVGPDIAGEPARLADDLLDGLLAGVVQIHAFTPSVAATAGERPLASPVARWAAGTGRQAPNAYHETIEFDAWTAAVLTLLDGSRDRVMLTAALIEAIQAGRVRLTDRHGRSAPARSAASIVAERLEPTLAWLARAALLVE